MNMPSTFPASPAGAAALPAARVPVWDAPVRLVHGLLIACFAGAWLTAESERLRLIHETLGWTMLGLVAFRIVWGFVGTRHARFASFVRGPAAALAHLKQLLARRVEHEGAGHNPAGGLAVLALLGGVALAAGSGWAAASGFGGHAVEELHEFVVHALLALVALHVAAVVVTSVLQRRNLVGAMVTGRAELPPSEGITQARRGVALLVLAAVLAFWAWQWQSAPVLPAGTAATAREHDHDGD